MRSCKQYTQHNCTTQKSEIGRQLAHHLRHEGTVNTLFYKGCKSTGKYKSNFILLLFLRNCVLERKSQNLCSYCFRKCMENYLDMNGIIIYTREYNYNGD